MRQNQLTAWLSIGSTYSYLTAMRIQSVLQQYDVALTIRPFSIRHVMKEIGNFPFLPSRPSKVNYMWRDIERRAARYGIAVPIVPAPYPIVHLDIANKVGIVMNDRDCYLAYFKTTYTSWFLHGHEAGSETNLRYCMHVLHQDYDEVMALISANDVRQRYRDNTAAALDMGIFGVPSFTKGKEIFWGDDRLEDALEYDD